MRNEQRHNCRPYTPLFFFFSLFFLPFFVTVNAWVTGLFRCILAHHLPLAQAPKQQEEEEKRGSSKKPASARAFTIKRRDILAQG